MRRLKNEFLIKACLCVDAAIIADGKLGPVAAMSVLGIGGGLMILSHFWFDEIRWLSLERDVRDYNQALARNREEMQIRRRQIKYQIESMRRHRVAAAGIAALMSALATSASKTGASIQSFADQLRDNGAKRESANKFKAFRENWHARRARSVAVPRQNTQGASDRPRTHTTMPKPRDNA